MFKAVSAPLKLWRTKRLQINIKVRKALIVSLIAPVFVAVSAPTPALANSYASGTACSQTITGSTAVTVTQDGNSCVIVLRATAANASTSYTWTVPNNASSVSILVVGGGGSGGVRHAAGGGAGGYRYLTGVSVTPAGTVSIAVGKGGDAAASTSGGSSGRDGNAGAASSFGSTSAAGGGGGGQGSAGGNGGSGGGGCCSNAAGSGNTPSVSPSQGNNGGVGTRGSAEANWSGGGGGGAGSVGGNSTSTSSIGGAGDYTTSGTVTGGAGGSGVSNNVTGSAVCYAAGGGGGVAATGANGGAGGVCGAVTSGGRGGRGGTGTSPNNLPTQGVDGTGSGGGGAGFEGSTNPASGRGGSGIVVIRYDLPVVTFSANGGSGTLSTTTSNVNSSGQVVLPTRNTLERNGYTFGGWNTAENGSGTNYAEGATFTPTGNITLYAQWRSVISYDANGGFTTRPIETTTALGSGSSTTLSTGRTSSGAVVTSGLSLYLDASNTSSYPGTGNIWYDISGNGKNATGVSSPAYDPINRAFSFDGTSQYFNLGNNFGFRGTESFTITVTFRTRGLGSTQTLLSKYQSGAGSYWTYIIDEKLKFGREASPWDFFSNGTVTPNEVIHATFVYNGATSSTYINGVFDSSMSSGSMPASTTLNAQIGAINGGSLFKGDIYSVLIHNRSLTQNEITQNYNALIPNRIVSKDSSTLAGWSTTADSSTPVIVGNNGTLLAGLPTPYIRLEAKNYNGTTWTPTNYTGSGITYSSTKPTLNSNQTGWGATGTFPTVSGLGSQSVGVYLNNSTLSSYTFCAMARYKTSGVADPASMGRIFTGTSVNWLSGWFSSGTKDFYHNGWQLSSSTLDYNWHYLCDSGNNIYWDGVKLAVTNQTYTNFPAVAIGGGYAGAEWSDFEVTEVILYDQFLNANQIAQVNQYFKNTYGIVAGTIESVTPNMVPPSNYASTGNSTLYARWGSTITYEGNGQTSGTPPPQQVFANGVGNLATNTGSLAEAGHTFVGWNTRADGTGTFYAPGASYSGPNLLLYAVYQVPVKFANTFAAAEPISLSPYMRFRATDYDASKKIWYDSSGNARNTSYVRGSPTLVTTTANAAGSTKVFQTVSGGANDGIQFKNASLSSGNWTIFSVARFSGAQTGYSRIFNGESGNFLFGFYGSEPSGAIYSRMSGVAHYGAWVTPNWSTDIHGLNWVLSTGYTDAYRSNGVLRGTSNGTTDNLPPMTINAGGFDYSEAWQVAETIIFDRKLSDTEIKQIEDYLASNYGISSYSAQQSYSESVTVNASSGSVTLSDTITAILGYRNTFSMAPTIPGITLESLATNQVRIRIANTVSPGTYWETVTVIDTGGNSSLMPVRINVFSPLIWSPSNPTSAQTTYGKQGRIRLDFSDGGTNKRVTLTHVSTPSSAAITIDTSTISSNFVTILVDTSTAVGTYQESITVTDSTGVTKNTVLTITVNRSATIAYPNSSSVPDILQSGLLVRYEMDSATSYTGSGTNVVDLQGRSNALLVGTTTFDRGFNGNLKFTGTQYLNMRTGLTSAQMGDTISVFMWVQPTGNGIILDERGQVNSDGTIADGWQDSQIEVVSGSFRFRTWNSSTISFTPAAGTAINTGWYYVGYVYNKSTLTFTAYVNGVAVGTPQTSFDRSSPIEGGYRQLFAIGQNDATNLGSGIKGSFGFGAFHLYGTALSAAEVLNNFLISKGRYTYLPTAGNLSLTATAGTARDFSIFTGVNGFGTKNISLSGANSVLTVDTSTVNTAVLKLSALGASTSTTSPRTYSETMTATDANGMTTPYYISLTVNPRIIVSTSRETITTTFGVAGTATLTATQGTGSLTFTRVSGSGSSAITMSANTGQATLTVAGTLPAGTYYETLTATDSIGATTSRVIVIVVNSPPSLVSASGSNTVETTFTRGASARLNVTGGTGNRTYALTYVSSTSRWRISIDTSTAASGFVTVNVDSYTATGTHSINIAVTDSVSATSSLALNIVVNDFPIINNVTNENSYVKPGLVLNLDAANPLSSTGAGNWKDLSGAGSSAVFTNAPTYSTTNGGIFTFNGSTNNLTFPSITTATSPGVTNGAFPEYTAETWVRFTSASVAGTACLICEGYTGTTGSINLALSIRNTGQIHSGYLPTTAQNWVETVTPTGTVIAGVWYHIASTVVRSGNNYINTIYVNGVAITSATSLLAPATSSRDYFIGRRWDSASQLLNGSIGVVRVYNRGLSQSEIQDNYNALVSRYINTSARSSTFTTTQGATFAATAIPVTRGTGNKTLTLTPVISGITSDTSTANAIRLNTASNLAATDTQTARTYLETITATDVAGASVTHLVNVVVNPPIILSAATTSIATTSGIETSTVITASRGSSAKTFTRTGTAGSGITLTSVGDQATLRVLSTINPGTYYETVTATDTASATTSIVFAIVVTPPPSLLGVSRLETSRGVLFKSPLYAISGGTGTLTMSVTNSPVNANITLTGTSLTGGFLQVGSGSETGTFTSTIRVTDARGAFSEIAVTVIVNAPVTLTGEFDIVKTYGDSVTKGYTTNSTGTAPFAFSATPVCAVVRTVSGSFTYERINGTDSCTWTAPAGVTAIDALLVGAGGGGGGDGGAGGGGGSINTLSSVSLPANRAVTVQVGAGGTGGAWGGPDASVGGTTSLVSGSTTYTAPGGSAGGGCGAAGAAGGLTGSGGTAVAGGNGGTGASGSCGAGAGSVGSNGPSSSFTGSSVTYGGGGGGGPFPDSISLVGLKAGGAGGGGTGTQASGQGSYGLPQYFKTSTSTPPNATLKQTITSDICGSLTGNISYSTDSEFPCSQKDNFQGWATGYFIAPVSGSITFYLSSDDSSQLVININGTDNNLSLSTCCTTVNATFNNFVAGQAYPINVYFTEVGGLASWKLEYAYAGVTQSVIPVSQFRSGSYGLATYFRKDNSTSALNKNTFTTGTCAQVIRNIDFANDAAFPCDGKDNFQGYATGYFIAPHTGSITFTMSSDDSSLLSINVNGTNRELPITIGSASATWDGFVKGQFYPISAFYTEVTGSAAWRLEYEFTGQSRIAIPTTYLRSNIDFTAPTAGTNGLGGGGGAGSAGLFKINGAQGGSGTAILKYLTQSDTATETMITAFVNQESPSGLLTLNVPSFVTVGDYSQVIKVQDAANSAPYSATVRIRVNKATPRTTISLPGSVLTATYGTPVTLSVAASTPGNVAFKKAGTNLTGCSSVATSNGVATCTWTPSVVETASISALLSPTDSVNFNNSVETASAISVVVGKADTLTVTANDLSATYSVDGSNVSNTTVPTRSISLTGLASIDSITAASYVFAGIINTGSSYSSSTTAPKEAGTYSITPSSAVFTSPALATNYRAVTYAPGTLTINRAARGSWTLTYGSGNNVITYGASKTETPTVVHPGDGTKLYSTSSTTCSVNSSSGVITTLAVGSCDITLVLNQSANWLSDTKTVTVTINRGIRTASLTPTASTIRYGETTTVTSTILPVLDSATVTYSAGSSPGCAIDNVTGEVTGIRAGSSCGISVLYDRTDLYESVTATASVTVNKALAPVVTTETITAVSYAGSVAVVSPTYRVSGILARDILQIIPTADVSDIPAIPANTYTAATGYRYFATSPTSYDSTTAPTDGGTYQVFARGLSLLSGVDISNYETPTYVSADLVINPIAQSPLRILLSAQESITVPFDITISGGSSTGALSVVVISGGASTGCSVTGLRLTTSQAGSCVLRAIKAADRNYLQVLSDTTTVVTLNFVSSFSWDTVFSGTGISISSEIPIVRGPETCSVDCMPTVTDIRDLSGNSITTMTVGTPIKIIGTNFNTTTAVYFSGRIGGVRLSSVPADSFQVDNDNTLTVMPPANFVPNAGENASNIGVRIVVLASGGSSFPNQQITIISL